MKLNYAIKQLLVFSLLLYPFFSSAQSLSEIQQQNARSTGYAIVASRNPGKNISIIVIPWDGTHTLEYNANNQINSGWHAQAAIKGNYFDQAFDGNNFTGYSSVVLSEADFNLYKSTGTQWWIVCANSLPPFSNSALTILDNQNVGIGTTTPSAFLHVVGNSTSLPELQLDHYQNNMGATTFSFRRARGTKDSPLPIINQDYVIGIEGWDYVGAGYGNGFRRNSYIVSQANGSGNALGTDLIFATSSGGSDANEGMRLDKNGNLGIGTTIPTEKLSVNGKIRAKEIKVEPNPATWPDYVFEEDYKVGTLEELEHYVKANKHLPEMPTAKEVAVNGVELGEMNKLLLKKVEELTLHLIEKDKEVQKLNVNFQELSKELLTIKDLLLKKK